MRGGIGPTVRDFFQLDRTLLFAMAGRVWQSLSGPITIVLLIQFLSLEDQGIYYGLVSVVGIQTFFELGLLNILVSQSAHLASEIRTPNSLSRMRQLMVAARTWFRAASLLFAFSAIGLGWIVLSGRSDVAEWQFPLIVLCLSAAGSVAISPDLAVLEGAGYRPSIYRSRLSQMVSGGLVVWLSLCLGFKYWALVFSSLVQFFWSAWLIWSLHRDFLNRMLDPCTLRQQIGKTPPVESPHIGRLSWLRDVLPLQWRVALVSLVYHAATQFFTLIVLYYHGQADAGRLGMTLTVTAAIQGMCLTWIQTKFALVSNLHGSGRREEAGALWRRSALVSTGLMVVAMSAAIVVVGLLPLAGWGWERRFIQPWQLAVLALGCIANHLIAVQSFYVLAQKGRPFLLPSLFGFSMTGLAVLIGGFWYSVSGVVVGYTITTALITLPGHSLAYWEYRKRV
jgi:hypothetical protein